MQSTNNAAKLVRGECRPLGIALNFTTRMRDEYGETSRAT